MARNPLKAEAEVTLSDGRTLTFAFDANAWIAIGEELGKERGKDWTPDEVGKVLADEDNPPSLKFQRVLLWGGLQTHHPEMTLRDAGAIMVEAADAMQRAMNGGMPVAEEGSADAADENPPKKRSGRGTVSATAGAVSA